MTYKYAIQLKDNGQLVTYCETEEQVKRLLDYSQELEVVNTDSASKVKVIYTELGGPWGYGHQEPSFITHGGLKKCIYNLCKWMKDSARTFGPDARDVRDFFRHCNLYVNGDDKTTWLMEQVEKINLKTMYL